MWDKKNWTDYGLLRSPLEELGMDKILYNDSRKKELYTNTNDYINQKNILLKDLLGDVNTTYETLYKRLGDVPHKEKQRVAMQAAARKKQEVLQIVDELYPMADQALRLAGNVNMAQEAVKGNIIGSASTSAKPRKKKGGRPKGSKNKKKTEKK